MCKELISILLLFFVFYFLGLVLYICAHFIYVDIVKRSRCLAYGDCARSSKAVKTELTY